MRSTSAGALMADLVADLDRHADVTSRVLKADRERRRGRAGLLRSRGKREAA